GCALVDSVDKQCIGWRFFTALLVVVHARRLGAADENQSGTDAMGCADQPQLILNSRDSSYTEQEISSLITFDKLHWLSFAKTLVHSVWNDRKLSHVQLVNFLNSVGLRL